MKKTLLLGIIVIASAAFSPVGPVDDPKEKLGLLIGRWEIEINSTGELGAVPGKIKTLRECRWAPQSHEFLVCASTASSPQGGRRLLSVFSYDAKESNYLVTIINNPGTKPQPAASLSIQGNLWITVTPSEDGGKTRQIRTTVDRSAAGRGTMKVELSEDGGVHWTAVANGAERKIGD